MAESTPSRGWRSLRGFLTFLTLVLVIACLYWASSVLIPVALAVLLTFVLAPVVNRVQQIGLGRTPAVILVVSVVGLLSLGLVWVVSAQVGGLIMDLPNYQENIIKKVDDLRHGSFARLAEEFQSFLRSLGQHAQDGERAQPVRVVSDNPVSAYASLLSFINPLLEPLATAGLVIVLLIFMLINREDLRNRVILLAGSGRMVTATKALDEAGQRISRYLLMQLFINASYGVMLALLLLAFGIPYALLWGLLAAVLRYIPYIGPWVAAVMPMAMAIAVLDGWMPLLLLAGLFIALELFSNMVMEPLLYGQSIGVSEASLLVAVAFWTWLWGAVGLVLSVPLTVCLVVLGKYVPALKCFDLLLGERPQIPVGLAIYQRLLAKDADEALELVQEQQATLPSEDLFDATLLASLISARQDLERDQLDEEEFDTVLQGIRALTVELAADLANGEKGDAASPPEDRPVLVGAPVRDESETVALHMLQPLLHGLGIKPVLLDSDESFANLVAAIEEHRPLAVCLAALPPGGLAATCLLCKRLRTQFAELPILVGRWGVMLNERSLQQLREAGATQVGMTLRQTAGQIEQLPRTPDTPTAKPKREIAKASR